MSILYDRKKKLVVWEMTALNASDVGKCLQDTFPLPDKAWYDGQALLDAADAARRP